MKTYEIFTEDGSQIIQAKNMASAIGRHGLVSGNIDKELIAIIEVERGQEFLTSDKQLPIHDVSGCDLHKLINNLNTRTIHPEKDTELVWQEMKSIGVYYEDREWKLNK